MRLPPGPGRCRQRAAADAARFPESFRARRALLETYPDPARLREPPSADRDVPPPARDTCGACPAPPPHRPPRADRTFRTAQTEYSTRCRQAMLRTAGHSLRRGRHKKTGTAAHSLRKGQAQKKTGRQPTLYAEAGTKKTGRQPTLGPARGTGYRDASSCRRPAICGKISAQITRRTGTARQPGQPVVQI